MGACCPRGGSDDRTSILSASERQGHYSSGSNYRNLKIVYHGTTSARADSILREGIRPSRSGMLGPGIYVSADYNKAWREAKKKVRQDRKGQPNVLEFVADVGNVMIIDNKDHPQRWNWQHTHDSAWVPPNTRDMCPIGGSEETCLTDPGRLQYVARYRNPPW